MTGWSGVLAVGDDFYRAGLRGVLDGQPGPGVEERGRFRPAVVPTAEDVVAAVLATRSPAPPD